MSPPRAPAGDYQRPSLSGSTHLLQWTNPSPHAHKVATAPKICSAAPSRRARAHPSPAAACRPTSPRDCGLAPQVSAIHFLHPVVRRVRCNTFLSGCQPPWPPPRCPDLDHAFAPCPGSGCSAARKVHPSSRAVLTTARPLACPRSARPGHPRPRLAPSVFVGRAHILRTARSSPHAAVLRDISAGTSYQTARLVFRPYAHLLPASCTSARLRPSTRVSTGFSHCRHSSLSFGSHHAHSPASIGPGHRPSASHPSWSPWSVFQYGSESSAYSPVLSLFPVCRRLFCFPSRYFFAIGLPRYLAFGAPTTASRCTTKQHYSPCARAPGLSPAPALPSIRFCAHGPQRLAAYHWGSSLFSRPYYGNPRSFLLLSLLICLSPGCSPALRASSGRMLSRMLLAFLRARHRPENQAIPYRGSSNYSVLFPQCWLVQPHAILPHECPAGPLCCSGGALRLCDHALI